LETENCKSSLRASCRIRALSPRAQEQFSIFSLQFSICTAFLLFLFVVFSLTTAAQTPTPSPAKTPTPPDDVDVLRTETDLTNLLFTATDKSNRYVTTLQQNDIRVLEDGVPQTVFTFQRETDRPLAIAFVIDVSISQERTLPDQKAAARRLIESLIRPNKDYVAIIPFEGYAHLEQPFTRNKAAIYQILETMEVAFPTYQGSAPPIRTIVPGKGLNLPHEGSTAIWDAIAVTCDDVLAGVPRSFRRTIILLTDGQDTSSLVKQSVAVDEAVKSETAIYIIGVGDNRYDGVNKNALAKIADGTGGRALFPKKNMLNDAFDQISSDLRSQYWVAYRSANHKSGGSSNVVIELTHPEGHDVKLQYRPRVLTEAASRSK